MALHEISATDPCADYAIVEVRSLRRLEQLEKILYSEKRMTADEMRDWANWLNHCFFENVELWVEG
jgi:hypothetical protein